MHSLPHKYRGIKPITCAYCTSNSHTLVKCPDAIRRLRMIKEEKKTKIYKVISGEAYG